MECDPHWVLHTSCIVPHLCFASKTTMYRSVKSSGSLFAVSSIPGSSSAKKNHQLWFNWYENIFQVDSWSGASDDEIHLMKVLDYNCRNAVNRTTRIGMQVCVMITNKKKKHSKLAGMVFHVECALISSSVPREKTPFATSWLGLSFHENKQQYDQK